MKDHEIAYTLAQLNARYARSLDTGRLEEWPDYFDETCTYRVTTQDNHRRGLPASLIYAKGKGMLRDRVQALRTANIYEAQSYRHVIGTALVERGEDGVLRAETPFFVVRTMRNGDMSTFAAGAYHDRFVEQPLLRLAERVVVCDSSRTNTLLAIPL